MPGPYTYQIPDAADQWVSRTATPEEQAFGKLDAAGVLSVVKRAMATEEQIAAAQQYQQDEKVFRKLYPSYRDTPRNAQLMSHHWKTKFGTEVPTLAQVEETFLDLRESGVIALDAREVAKEDGAAIAQRADQIRAERKAGEFNEIEAYAMPMADLEAHCRGWK